VRHNLRGDAQCHERPGDDEVGLVPLEPPEVRELGMDQRGDHERDRDRDVLARSTGPRPEDIRQREQRQREHRGVGGKHREHVAGPAQHVQPALILQRGLGRHGVREEPLTEARVDEPEHHDGKRTHGERPRGKPRRLGA
jgi:hypothetical protein